MFGRRASPLGLSPFTSVLLLLFSLNLTLEKVCDADQSQAEILLRNNSLVSLFRVGFGLVLKLRWEIEQWVKTSWFDARGLGLNFWTDEWGQTLKGILKKSPSSMWDWKRKLHSGILVRNTSVC